MDTQQLAEEKEPQLSKRELMALSLAQALLNDFSYVGSAKNLAKTAVECADALIAELNEAIIIKNPRKCE